MKLSYFIFNVNNQRTYLEYVKHAFDMYDDVVSSDLIFRYMFLELDFAILRIFEKKEKFKLGDYKWKQK